MTLSEISTRRLGNQCVIRHQFHDPVTLVQHMGAMQAQDFPMSRWALGLRLPGATDAGIQHEIDKGSIIRTHVMRPTWHLVSAADIRWMIALSARTIRSQMTGRNNDLGLTVRMLERSAKLLQDALAGGLSMSRKELADMYANAGIPNTDNRLAHLLMEAELDCLICSGPSRGKETTYAWMDDRVPVYPVPDRDVSLQKLALVYFSSHGPATLSDFTWWSGLPVSQARLALELNKTSLESFDIDGQAYWMAESPDQPATHTLQVMLVPAYDELIISYKDRRAILNEPNMATAISSNGIFRPVILVDGRAAGIWKRTHANGMVTVETLFFNKKGLPKKQDMELACHHFLNFMGGQASKSHE